jgi:D-glycero-D-manno-heptose 1,7-bisphosphate phosphatase
MQEGEYVRSLRDLRLLPGVPEAIARLNRASFRTIVVTNQRGIALGLYTPADVESIHAAMQAQLEAHGGHIDGFFFCPHDRDECNCRKPLGGLFDQAAQQFPGIDAESSVMIGDSLSDVEFGRRLGMMTIFIAGDPALQKPGAERAAALADSRADSLAQAVNALLEPNALTAKD